MWALAALCMLVSRATWAAPITGVVFHDADGDGARGRLEAGIAGVSVSDGRQVVPSDGDGRIRLTVTEGFACVFVSIPSGWWPTGNRWWVSGESDALGAVSFGLQRQRQDPASGYFISVTDIHITPAAAPRVREFCAQVNAMRPRPAFVVATGDLIVDATAALDREQALALFTLYTATMANLQVPLFSVPGNHDHPGYLKPEPWAGDPHFGKGAFSRLVGPLHYSWDWGPYHFVALDNTMPDDPLPGYHAELTPDCLAWLARDLTYVPLRRPLVLVMHQPLESCKGADGLARLLEGRQVVGAFAGHTHRVRQSRFGPSGVWELGALSGAYWAGPCPDGSPPGYAIIGLTPEALATPFYNALAARNYVSAPKLLQRDGAGYRVRAYIADQLDMLTTAIVGFDGRRGPATLQCAWGPVKQISADVPTGWLGEGSHRIWAEAGSPWERWARYADISIGGSEPDPESGAKPFYAATEGLKWLWGELMLRSTHSDGRATPDELLTYHSDSSGLDFVAVTDAPAEWVARSASGAALTLLTATERPTDSGLALSWSLASGGDAEAPVYGWYGAAEMGPDRVLRIPAQAGAPLLLAADPSVPEPYLFALGDRAGLVNGVFAEPGSSWRELSSAGPWTVAVINRDEPQRRPDSALMGALRSARTFASTDRDLRPLFGPADALTAQRRPLWAAPVLTVGFADQKADAMFLTRIHQNGVPAVTVYHDRASDLYRWSPGLLTGPHNWVVEMVQADGGRALSSPVRWDGWSRS